MGTALFPDLVVNGETIPHAVVAAEVQNHAAPRGKPGIAWRKAANAVALRTLFLQEARHRGLTADPLELSPGKIETQDEAMIRVLLDEAVTVPPPDEAAVQAEWARDPGRFRAPPLWDVSHILCACDPRDETMREAAFLRATDLAARAQSNPDGFARLAAEHSDCGSRSAGGALGQLRPGDSVPEFEDGLRRMKSGEITTAPVLTRHGWHVIRMEAVAEGDVLPFEVVRPRITEAMEKTAWARLARDFVSRLLAGAEISGADLGREGKSAAS